MSKTQMDPEAEIKAIQKKLGYLTLDLPTKYWLDTGSKLLNAVLGSQDLGLAYGKLIELFGFESNGKSLLALLLAGLAQEDGATVGWVDLENSFDPEWAAAQDLDPHKTYVFRSGLIQLRNKGARLMAAEELFHTVETWMADKYLRNPEGKIFLAVDSVTAMLVGEEAEAGLTGQNMRTGAALASFLSKMLRRWCALAQQYNAMIVFINQIRTSPGKRFGNPEYTPGGKALKFYCSIRVSMRRLKAGRVLQGGKVVGLIGVVRNLKNKAGGGSVEAHDVGFKTVFAKGSWKFLPVKKLKAEEGE